MRRALEREHLWCKDLFFGPDAVAECAYATRGWHEEPVVRNNGLDTGGLRRSFRL
ncbi:hypothetical protein JXA88_13915 [Candidatus Fermentibacteria bacterium]|nr:hypothetical protein [Candidatus Fermentibacteria bacterium]